VCCLRLRPAGRENLGQSLVAGRAGRGYAELEPGSETILPTALYVELRHGGTGTTVTPGTWLFAAQKLMATVLGWQRSQSRPASVSARLIALFAQGPLIRRRFQSRVMFALAQTSGAAITVSIESTRGFFFFGVSANDKLRKSTWGRLSGAVWRPDDETQLLDLKTAFRY